MGKRNNTILQSAFFSLAKVMPEEQAIQYMKDAATHSYLKKGQDIVDMNHKAIDARRHRLQEDRRSRRLGQRRGRGQGRPVLKGKPELVKQVKDILDPIDTHGRRQPAGLRLHAARGRPVRAGRCRLREARRRRLRSRPGTQTKCIQCNNCAYVCPHATIRPFALDRGGGQERARRCQDRCHQGR